MRNIYLILIGLTFFAHAELTRNSSGIVTDSINKLQWQDNINPYDTQKQVDLRNAYLQCEDLTLGGYDDWRLPNINELASLIDYSKYNPVFSSVFKNHSNNENQKLTYWSSTTNQRDKHQFAIRFNTGQIFSEGMYKTGLSIYARCVRSVK